jgi:hypothetical protein
MARFELSALSKIHVVSPVHGMENSWLLIDTVVQTNNCFVRRNMQVSESKLEQERRASVNAASTMVCWQRAAEHEHHNTTNWPHWVLILEVIEPDVLSTTCPVARLIGCTGQILSLPRTTPTTALSAKVSSVDPTSKTKISLNGVLARVS